MYCTKLYSEIVSIASHIFQDEQSDFCVFVMSKVDTLSYFIHINISFSFVVNGHKILNLIELQISATEKILLMTTVLEKARKLLNSITSARISKALCIFSAGILISISIQENCKDVSKFPNGSDTDLSFLLEIVRLNQNLAMGLVSGFLIGASHV